MPEAWRSRSISLAAREATSLDCARSSSTMSFMSGALIVTGFDSRPAWPAQQRIARLIDPPREIGRAAAVGMDQPQQALVSGADLVLFGARLEAQHLERL